ncbi:MAG: hypothetical protein JW934_08600 [Anaerolineae bacterium]|nr:hypothetical protein [Anaerolineae bacterium]
MKAVVTAVNDLYAGDSRLDASYHASEGVRALRRLRRWAGAPAGEQGTGVVSEARTGYAARRLDALKDIAQIFNGPRFARTYVTDPDRGVPFLSSSDMLQADLGGVKLLSRKNMPDHLLSAIRIQKGWTLISCSGTIGNTVYVRSDMDGMTGSQHIMRVVPDEQVIQPGYLFAVLSSPIGYALLTQGTYGAVVQHIEPKHIADLPIPRLDAAIEERIHALVERAAALRVEAQSSRRKALALASEQLRTDLSLFATKNLLAVPFSRLNWRFEATYHTARETAAEIFRSSHVPLVPIGDLLIDMFYLGKLHRVFVDNPEHGVPLLSIADAQKIKLSSDKYVSRTQSRNVNQAILQPGWVLVSRVGTPGLVTYVRREMAGMAGTDHLVRLVCDSARILSGYLYAVLSSQVGYGLLVGSAHGSVQLVLPPEYIARIEIPLLPLEQQKPIHDLIESYSEALSQASKCEDQAQALLVEALRMG